MKIGVPVSDLSSLRTSEHFRYYLMKQSRGNSSIGSAILPPHNCKKFLCVGRTILKWDHCIKHNKPNKSLSQSCPTCGPRAACGLLAHFMRPPGPTRKIVQVAKTIIAIYLLIVHIHIYMADFLFCASELTQYLAVSFGIS